MPLFDLPPEELRSYRPDVAEPADFDAFWAATLAETRAHPLGLVLTPVDVGLALVEVHDVRFAGFGGHEVRGWLLRPAGVEALLPAIVHYPGYGSGRGLAHQHLLWATAGYACLVMDVRGQGAIWATGNTPDPVGSPPSHPGFVTRGIHDPHEYYYRRVFADAVRAVEAVRACRGVDAERVTVVGCSQGGGIALAVAGLVTDLQGAAIQAPFLCHIRRAVEIANGDAYLEVATFLRTNPQAEQEAFATLSYFDGVGFARRATTAALFAVGLMDSVCPPSTGFAAFNAYAGDEKKMLAYPFSGHDGGGGDYEAALLRWVVERMPSPAATR